MQRFNGFLDGNPSASPAAASSPRDFKPDEHKLIAEFLVHCADVSNPCKPWAVCRPWADRIVREFFEQVLTAKPQTVHRRQGNCNLQTVCRL
jgi:hypothetical protein